MARINVAEVHLEAFEAVEIELGVIARLEAGTAGAATQARAAELLRSYAFPPTSRPGPRPRQPIDRDELLTLATDSGIGDRVPRPKGVRLATYDKHLTRIWRAEDIVEAHGELLLSKLKGVAVSSPRPMVRPVR